MGWGITPLKRGLIILFAGCLILTAGVVVGAAVRQYDFYLPQHRSYWQEAAPYDSAYDHQAAIPAAPAAQAVAIIVPHHLMVSNYTAAVFAQLEHFSYQTVVLIGPNHYGLGEGTAITSRADWDTPYGTVTGNRRLVSNLVRQHQVVVDEAPFAVEHSISGLVPFVRRSFPQANIIPIIFQPTATVVDGQALGQILAQITDQSTTLVIGSVDFSHDKSASIADANDIITAEVITTGAIDRLAGIDADSPASVAAVMAYAQSIGNSSVIELFHTNSGRLIGRPEEPTTSHFGWIFN